jgi:hypothetical protein
MHYHAKTKLFNEKMSFEVFIFYDSQIGMIIHLYLILFDCISFGEINYLNLINISIYYKRNE